MGNRAAESTGSRLIVLGVLFVATNLFADATFDKYVESGNYSAAVKYADENIPAVKRDAALWAKLGYAHEQQNMTEKALACYMVALRTDPKSYDGSLGAARVYNKLGQAGNAQSMAKKAMDINPTGEASWEYARSCIALGKPQDAKKALEKVVDSDPGNVVASKELGTLYYEEKNFDKALPLLKVAQSKNPDADVALRLGRVYRDMDSFDLAVNYFKEAARDKKSPKPEATAELARLYYKQEQFAQANSEYEKTDQYSLAAEDLYRYAASIEKSGGDKAKAGRLYESAGAKFGNSTSKEALICKEKLGRTQLERKNYTEALNTFNAIYKADSTGKIVPDIIYLIADANAGLGNDKKAMQYLEKIIAKEPENVEAHARLADLYVKQGMADRASQVYEKLVALQPNSPKIHKALGEYNFKNKRYEEALKNYQKSFTLEPDATTAQGMMQSAWELGKVDLARDAAETALHYDPNLRDPQVILAKIYMKDKNYVAAKGMLEKLSKKEDSKEIWQQLATCYEATNDPAKLAEADKKLMGFDRKNTGSRLRFANYAISAGDFKGASDALKELMELTPKDPTVVKKLYEVSLKAGTKDEAVNYLKKYAALRPEDATAQKDLGNLLYDRKDNSGAIAAYRTAVKADPGIKGIYKNYVDLVLAAKLPESEIVPVLTAAVKAGEGDANIYTTLGGIYQRQGIYGQAIDMYQKALQLKPQNFDVLSSLAVCQEKAGKISDAIISYEQATAMNPTGSSKEQRSLGDLYMQQGKKGASMGAYKKYLERNPTDIKTAKMVGDYEYDQKNYNEAVKYMAMVSGEEGRKADFLLRYANAEYQTKDYFKATELYKQLTVLLPKTPEPFKILYEISKNNNDMTSASNYLKRYCALKPEDGNMQMALGDILYNLKDNTGALNAYRTVLKINPNAKGFYKKYVELVLAQGTEDEKIRALSGAIGAGEGDTKMYAQLGEFYRKAGNYPRAITNLQKASQLDPKNADLLSSLAECQAKSGATSDAVITYEQAVALNPNANREYKALGDLYMAQKKTDQAIKIYKKYLEKNSDNDIARTIGEYAYKNKNYTEAVKYLALVKGDVTKSADFLQKYADASYQAKDDQKALGLYRQLAVLTPGNAQVFYNLSDLCQRTGSQDEALMYLKKYAALKPGDSQSQKLLGDILYDKKDYQGALTAYRSALKVDPSAKGLCRKYADLVMKMGIKEEMVSALTGAINAGDADVKMYSALADIYKGQGNCQKAIPLYEKASSMDARNTNLLTALADCQLKTGNTKEAVVTLEQAIAMNPGSEKEYKLLGDLYMAQKKTDSAIKSYKKYLEKEPSDYAVARLVGEQAFKAGDNAEASRYFGMVGGENAKKPDFLMMYGKAAFAMKDDPRALRIFKELATINPKDPVVQKILYEACVRTGAAEEGVQHLKQYAALSPNDATAQKTLADLLYDRNDSNGALMAYRNVLKVDPNAKGFYKKYVELVMKMGTPEEKLKALNGAISAGEADGGMYSALANIYRSGGNNQKAIELFNKASQLEPRNPNHLTNMAECQIKTNDLKGASITLEQAIAINPTAVKEYKALGDLYTQQRKTDAAMGAYKKYLDKAPDDHKVARLVGSTAFNMKAYDQAVKYLAMLKGETDPEYLIQYGLACIETKDPKTAIPVLEKLRATRGGSVPRDVAYKALADAYDKAGNQVKAAEVLEDYTKLPGVNDPEASYRKALMYESINPATAARMYEENISQYPKDGRNHLKLGIYYSKNQSTAAKAVMLFEKCIQISDTIPRVWFELGTLYGKLRRDKDMLRAYRKFIEVDPENAEACARIGENLLLKNMTDDAMVFLEMANAQKADDPKVMTMLAKGHIRTNRPQEGAKILERVMKIAKGSIDDEMKVVMADVYLESGKYKDAVDILQTLIDKKRDNTLLLKYAKALVALQRYTEAAEAIETIKATDPENIEAHMMMGKIKVVQKKLDEAVETYKEVLYINPEYAPALYERANVYLLQAKIQWAKTFFERALRADPKFGLAELGLARLAKQQKDFAGYQDHLDKARKLDPNNREIMEEARSTRR